MYVICMCYIFEYLLESRCSHTHFPIGVIVKNEQITELCLEEFQTAMHQQEVAME